MKVLQTTDEKSCWWGCFFFQTPLINLDDKHDMKKAIGAILFHWAVIADGKSRHGFCPPGEDMCNITIIRIITKMFSWSDSEPKRSI